MQAPFTQPEPHFPPPGERSLMVHSASPDEGLSTLALVNALLRQRVLVVVLPILLVAGVAAYELSRPRQYVSSAAFMPQGPDSRSRMSGLAAQFGIAIPAVDGGQSPSFYVELIGSREILVSLVRAQYTFDWDGQHYSGTLVELLKARGEDAPRRLEDAVKRLAHAIVAAKSRETNVVNVAVTTKWPQLSTEILTRLLQALNDFNLGTRRTQAANERVFTERRLAEATADLRDAETRLREFQRQNRQYQGSPDLLLEYDRLQRTVQFRQQMYTTLAQSFEQARIDEVRDTPVLTVIAHPNVPPQPASRGIISKSALAAGAGLMLAVLIAIGRALVERRQTNTASELEEFRALRQDAFADLLNPFRPISRAFRRRRAAS